MYVNEFHISGCFQVPKKKGILKMIDSGNNLTTDVIIKRIIHHRWVSYQHVWSAQTYIQIQRMAGEHILLA